MSKSNITYLQYPPLAGHVGEAWNPIIGCTHSGYSGCDQCWARELHTQRHAALLNAACMPEQYRKPFEEIQVLTERLNEPRSWKKRPRLVMVCPQSDLFHDDVPAAVIYRMLGTMADYPSHQFFVLTKRPQRAAELLASPTAANDAYIHAHVGLSDENPPWPLHNLGVLVSVSDQHSADALLPWLLKIPAAWRGVSYEPAVGPVDFMLEEDYFCPQCHRIGTHFEVSNPDDFCSMACSVCHYRTDIGVDFPVSSGIDLVIAGCESGRNARPAQADWFRAVRDQCQSAGVAFYLKQMQLFGRVMDRPLLDGHRWLQWPGGER